MGVDRQSPLRARAVLRFVLQELTKEGHCAYPLPGVLERAVHLTGIGENVLSEAISHLVERGDVKIDKPRDEVLRTPRENLEDDPQGSENLTPRLDDWLYLRHLYEAEVDVAEGLVRLLQQDHPLPGLDLDSALGWTEKKMGIDLAPAQREAIRRATTSKVLVITGGPGVGKTTIVRGILEIFQAKKMKCGLCALTGRAAKRLAETTGREARTIHRLLGFEAGSGRPNRDADHPLELDLLIVDETSMVDLPLMAHLVRALPAHVCLVLVGDIDQLPSVGPGMVLRDVIASGVVPVVRLTEIFRQAQESGIVQAAYNVLHGEMPVAVSREDKELTDFYIVEAESPGSVIERIVSMVCDRIPARFGLDPLRDIQVLTPMHKAELGTRNLNQHLQSILNPPDDGPEVERFGWKFRIGDKVLQTVNDYDKEVFNGDIGRIHRINVEDQEMIVDFDGRLVHYEFEDLDELILAYAMTIHKSQGSEYPAVVLPLHTQHYMMLQRNLLYTGITRGKKLVVLVGPRKALSMAVQRQDTAKRYTALASRLKACAPKAPSVRSAAPNRG